MGIDFNIQAARRTSQRKTATSSTEVASIAYWREIADGQPLPPQLGAPWRLLLPGSGGGANSAKWIDRLEVTEEPGSYDATCPRPATQQIHTHHPARPSHWERGRPARPRLRHRPAVARVQVASTAPVVACAAPEGALAVTQAGSTPMTPYSPARRGRLCGLFPWERAGSCQPRFVSGVAPPAIRPGPRTIYGLVLAMMALASGHPVPPMVPSGPGRS